MSQVKLPYYPQIQAIMSVSPFGVQEINLKDIYNHPIPNKTVVRIDLLESLRDTLGDACMFNRDILYRMCSGGDNCEALLLSYYRKFRTVRSLVNEQYFYYDDTAPINDRIFKSLREIINAYGAEVMDKMEASGGKYLVSTHDFVYFAFNLSMPVPVVKGGTLIC